MLHAREDYNRIQDPADKIGKDEPVFLVRAKDKLAPALMKIWAVMLLNNGGDSNLAQMVTNHAAKAREWQAKNGCKLPDL